MGKTFDEILTNIEKELAELRAMNNVLIKENALLRQKCDDVDKKTSKDSDVLLLSEACEQLDDSTLISICRKNGLLLI